MADEEEEEELRRLMMAFTKFSFPSYNELVRRDVD